MVPLLLTVGLFATWWVVGVALLAAVGADTQDPRVALSAPILGTCVTALLLLTGSRLGLPVDDFGRPLLGAMLLGAAAVLARTRPRLAGATWPVLGICLAGLALFAWPMLDLGFRWIANANDDMAIYVLGATRFVHDGFNSGVHHTAISHGRDYWSLLTVFDASGARPGSALILAWMQDLTGRLGHEIFMPTIAATQLCLYSAVGALGAAARPRAATLAACLATALIVVSPLTAYGFVQQLIGQVWGLGLLAVIVAWVLRRELWRAPGPRRPDVIVIGVLFATLLIGYSELLPVLAGATVIFLVTTRWRGGIDWRPVMAALPAVLAIAVVSVNTYLPAVASYIRSQVSHGTATTDPDAPLFGFIFTPASLPGTLGFQPLPAPLGATLLDLSIGVALVVLVAVTIAAVRGTIRGQAAAAVLVVEIALAAVLAIRGNDFGLFKLTMFSQPFLAVLVASAMAGARTSAWRGASAAGLAAFAAVALPVTLDYVRHSRDPVDVPAASAAGQLPAYAAQLRAAHGAPVVSAFENLVLMHLQAADTEHGSVHFLAYDGFGRILTTDTAKSVPNGGHAGLLRARRLEAVPRLSFRLGDGGLARFDDQRGATAALSVRGCRLVLPGSVVSVLNRAAQPPSGPPLLGRPCTAVRDTLAFVRSSRSEEYYVAERRRTISLYQLEPDPLRPGTTFAGAGRYLLARVLGPTRGMRLLLDVTGSVLPGPRSLPPARVLGGGPAARLPLEGHGSARVLSPPLSARMLGGVPYLMLDLGRDGRLPRYHRSGLAGLYGGGAVIDPRFLVAYVRDVSLVQATGVPPALLATFPADLADSRVLYSGLYEDGWLAGPAWVRLTAPVQARVEVSGETFPAAVPAGGLALRVLVDGREVARSRLRVGRFRVAARYPGPAGPHRIDLQLGAPRPLPNGDGRPATVHLTSIGFTPGAR